MLCWLFMSRNIACLIAKAEYALILFGQIAKERGVQKQRMVPIVHIVWLQPHRRLVVIIKERVSRLENRHALSVYSSGIEKECRTCSSCDFDDLEVVNRFYFCIVDITRVLFSMTGFHIVEGPAANISQVNCELHFSRNEV